jgi:DNA-binding transcriptional LysR family regulator
MIESIEELRLAVRIAELGSLSAAAQARGESVNAVSRRLALLEKRLGVTLFQRTTRRLSLSDEGRELVAGAGRILGELEALEARLIPRGKRLTGVVRVGLRPELVEERWFEALARALSEHREVSVQLKVVTEASDPFAQGLDLWVHFGRPAPSALVARKVGDAEWVMAASTGYAKAHGVPSTVAELSGHDCLLGLRTARETHWTLKDPQGREHTVKVGGRFESDNPNALTAALHAGLGIGFRPRGEVARAAASGQVVPVLPGFRSWSVPIYLMTTRARSRLPRVRLIWDLVAAAARAMIDEG